MDKCYIINDNHCEITIDNNLFDKEVIIQTTYKYIGDYFVECITEGLSTHVLLRSKNGEGIDEFIPQQFQNDLIDQSLRYKLSAQFGHIREKIIEEAFAPIN